MKIEGQHRFDAPRDEVWAAVMDAEVIGGILPGCEDLQPAGENRFAGALKMKVGPVQGVFQGSVELSDIVPPESYRLTLKGKGAPGFVQGEGQISLDEEEGGTVLSYAIDAKVGGRIASVGQRLLDSSAKVLTRQAMEGLERQVAARVEVPAGETPVAVENPSQAEMAADFASGVAREMVPAKVRRVAPFIGVLLALGLLALVFRSCSV